MSIHDVWGLNAGLSPVCGISAATSHEWWWAAAFAAVFLVSTIAFVATMPPEKDEA